MLYLDKWCISIQRETTIKATYLNSCLRSSPTHDRFLCIPAVHYCREHTKARLVTRTQRAIKHSHSRLLGLLYLSPGLNSLAIRPLIGPM